MVMFALHTTLNLSTKILLLSVQPLINTNHILNYVSSLDVWSLTETGKTCPDIISNSKFTDGLDDCKTYCESNGAKRLAFRSRTNYCRCCTASSELLVSSSGHIYTLQGNYNLFPTTNWC